MEKKNLTTEVFFDVIGYPAGKPKQIRYKKRFKNCQDACSHLRKLENNRYKLFYVIRPELAPNDLILFENY